MTTTPPGPGPGHRRERRNAQGRVLAFVGRRLLASVLVLLAASFVVHLLLSYSLDPLEDLYTSTAPNREQLVQERIDALDLDVPAPLRYLSWLQGAAGCLVGRCDLGSSWVSGEPVVSMLATAIPSTLTLVTTAAVLAIGLGVGVGVASALRRHTAFDHGVTVVSFVLYSLPAFWVAVLLKVWGAIGFNDALADPRLRGSTVLAVAVLGGLAWQAVVGGEAPRRLRTFLLAAAALAAMLLLLSTTGWLAEPQLGPLAILVVGATAAVGITALAAGLRRRRVLWSTLTTVAVGVVLYLPLQPVLARADVPAVLGLGVAAAAVGAAVGATVGGGERRAAVAASVGTALVVGALVLADRLMAAWPVYTGSRTIGGRPVATIGARTPGLDGDLWIRSLDVLMHLALPTAALVLVSFAAYTRYTRAGVLEVRHLDHVLAARARGLPARTVTGRHVLRNALVPLATLVPLDLANLAGGALIIERVFAWNGMGALFLTSLDSRDVEPAMGYFLVVGVLLVLANVVVDLLYVALDPRVRVER